MNNKAFLLKVFNYKVLSNNQAPSSFSIKTFVVTYVYNGFVPINQLTKWTSNGKFIINKIIECSQVVDFPVFKLKKSYQGYPEENFGIR